MDEVQLKQQVIQLKKSDMAALKLIVGHFHTAIYKFLIHQINDTTAAEDLLQETFIRLWENRAKLNENLSLKSYLFTTASNLSLNYIRHQKVVLRFKSDFTQSTSFKETPYFELEYQEIKEALNKTIASMSDKVRMVFMLCKVEGLSYKEISQRLNISVATVESHMVKALKMIREDLDKYNKGASR